MKESPLGPWSSHQYHQTLGGPSVACQEQAENGLDSGERTEQPDKRCATVAQGKCLG